MVQQRQQEMNQEMQGIGSEEKKLTKIKIKSGWLFIHC